MSAARVGEKRKPEPAFIDLSSLEDDDVVYLTAAEGDGGRSREVITISDSDDDDDDDRDRPRRSDTRRTAKRQRRGPSSSASKTRESAPPPPPPLVAPVHELGGKSCPICMEPLVGGDRVLVISCPCRYHEKCLHEWIVSAVGELRVPVPCPTCSTCRGSGSSSGSSSEAASGAHLSDRDVLQHLQSTSERDKYEKASLEKAMGADEGLRYCQTPDCEYAFYLSPEDVEAARRKGGKTGDRCPLCRKHLRIEMEEEEEGFQALADRRGYRKCRCGRRIEKMGGCDKVRCICGYKFCFRCGAANAACNCTARAHGFLPQSALLRGANASPLDDIPDLLAMIGAGNARVFTVRARGRGGGQQPRMRPGDRDQGREAFSGGGGASSRQGGSSAGGSSSSSNNNNNRNNNDSLLNTILSAIRRSVGTPPQPTT